MEEKSRKMRKAFVSLMIAIILCTVFIGIKLGRSAASDGMHLNPEELVLDPPMNGSTASFLWNLTLDFSDPFLGWKAKVMWDPSVLRCLNVSFSTYLLPPVDNNVSFGPSGDWVELGQIATSNVSGGIQLWLATITFTMVTPGATKVAFLESKAYAPERNLLPPYGNTTDAKFRTNRPHPEFTWKTDDGINPLPNHTVYDGGNTMQVYDIVHFNASQSYDVGNLVWNGSAFVPGAGFPDIVNYRWEFGDGTFDEGASKALVDHTYQNYNRNGWLVNLTVWDSEGERWSTTWRYGGPLQNNTVPMWRDVAISDIRPSLPPYQNWTLYGDDWFTHWWFDSTDFWIPYTWDQYWDYPLSPTYTSSFGLPSNTTVKDAWLNYNGSAGLWILVTATNFGSVPEKARINLYALGLKVKVTKPAGQPIQAVLDESPEQIGTWAVTINASSSTGIGCHTRWLPPKNMTYLLFATIEAADSATIADQDRSNNYLALSKPICNLCIWNTTDFTMIKDLSVAKFLCDMNGDGTVSSADLTILIAFYGTRPTGWPKAGPIPIVPK